MRKLFKLYQLRKKYPLCKIDTVNIAEHTILGEDVHIKSHVDIDTGVKIGAYSYVNSYTVIKDTVIGRFCSIAGFCSIGADSHPINWLSTSPKLYGLLKFNQKESYTEPKPGPVIGNDVWIGVHSIIMRGIHIGDGAIVGAGSIVTKDVPPFAIVAGNPAKIIKYRFSEEVIGLVSQLKWWNIDKKDLEKYREIIALKEDFYTQL